VSARELGLTGRQAQVLALILQGKPNKVICRELGLAEGTVKIHVAAILRALNVSTRTQAVIEASRLGLHLEPQAASAAAQPRQ
jgi:DNA-binding NarL/FixJ family response regulator